MITPPPVPAVKALAFAANEHHIAAQYCTFIQYEFSYCTSPPPTSSLHILLAASRPALVPK